MACEFEQGNFFPTGPGTWSSTITIGGTPHTAVLDLTTPTPSGWTLTLDGGAPITADLSSTVSPFHAVFLGIVLDCGTVNLAVGQGSCGSIGPPGGNCLACDTLPASLFVSSSGWVNGDCVDCATFNGTVELSNADLPECTWASELISICGADWQWSAHFDGSVWSVMLTNMGGGGHFTFALATPSCTLPITLSSQGATGTTACVPPATVVLSA